MNRTLTVSALLAALTLGACATPPSPSPALVEARSAVRSAELDPAVLNYAPLELKKATASLARADDLLAKGEAASEVNSVAYIATQQAKTALAVAKAKANDAAVGSSQVERERARADVRTVEAQRAQTQTAAAEQRASGAEQQAAAANANAAGVQQQNAQLQQRLTDLQAKQTERGMLVTLGDVLFEYNRAEVKPGAQASLRKLAEFLQQYPNRQVLIEGYTDDTGSAAYNEALSLRRAEAVDSALVGMGVASQRVATAGYGEDFPIASNSSDTNRALNRRVEVYIAENDQPVRARR